MARVIDADTHVSESTSMWEHIDPAMYPRRPVVVTGPTDTRYGGRNAFWLIDGNIFPRPGGKGGFRLITPSAQAVESARTDIVIGCREITNVPARLADMAHLGIDAQVVYPTLFLIYLTDDVDLEIALCRAYNRFLGQVWEQAPTQLYWTVVPPLRDVDASIAEIRWAKEHGAVGVFLRGVERDRTLDDPYFFPIYEEAQALDLPITIHTGAGCPAWTAVMDIDRNTSFPQIRVLPILAFRDLLHHRIPEQFPRLRFGFIEAGASWVPYVLHNLKRQFRVEDDRWGPRYFAENRIFIACEANEDLPYLMQYIGEDQLIIGSDYGHNDPSEEAQLVATMHARGDLSIRTLDKIFGDNPARLYGL
jgi:uncharacterized protein